MTACWGLHKKGSLYEGLLRSFTTAAETLHEQERLQGAFVKRGNLLEGLWGVCLWACVLAPDYCIASLVSWPPQSPAAGRARYVRMRSMARGPDSHAGELRRAYQNERKSMATRGFGGRRPPRLSDLMTRLLLPRSNCCLVAWLRLKVGLGTSLENLAAQKNQLSGKTKNHPLSLPSHETKVQTLFLEIHKKGSTVHTRTFSGKS
jgi:hypothetical protein